MAWYCSKADLECAMALSTRSKLCCWAGRAWSSPRTTIRRPSGAPSKPTDQRLSSSGVSRAWIVSARTRARRVSSSKVLAWLGGSVARMVSYSSAHLVSASRACRALTGVAASSLSMVWRTSRIRGWSACGMLTSARSNAAISGGRTSCLVLGSSARSTASTRRCTGSSSRTIALSRMQPADPSTFGRRAEIRRQGSGWHVAAAGEGAAEGDLIGVLEVAADREATGEPGHADPEGREQAREVHGGRLAFDVGVGGQDHLADAVGLDPGQQLADVQVVRSDPLDRADRAAEDVVAAAELARLLDRDQVARLLDHADQGGVAPRVPADAADVALGDIPADAAEMDPRLDLEDRAGQTLGVGRLHLEQVEGDPLSALGPDPRHPPQLVDEILNRTFVNPVS